MVDKARVRWLCRRGMKELDVLLERFLASEYDGLDDAGRDDFKALLEYEDPVLWEWLLGSSRPDDPNLDIMARRIRDMRTGT